MAAHGENEVGSGPGRAMGYLYGIVKTFRSPSLGTCLILSPSFSTLLSGFGGRGAGGTNDSRAFHHWRGISRVH